MKDAICTIGVGIFRISRPRKISRAVVVAERFIATKIPSVPLATMLAPASKPSRYKFKDPTSNRSPLPKKGIKRAKKIKGISINDLLATVVIGNLATWVTEIIIKKKAMNAGQFEISVETATIIKRSPATILMWAGI
jgi:hypothetical protein